MKIKLGAIGPRDSLEKILLIAKEFGDEIETVSYVYKHKEETVRIIEEFEKKADVIIFTGRVPYLLAKNSGKLTKPAVFIPRVGTTLVKMLFELHRDGIDYSKMSIDSIEKSAMDEVVDEMNIDFKNFYIIPYDVGIDYDELADFHKDLWDRGLTNIAVTGLTRTYQRLIELGVPAIKMQPTTFIIREHIKEAIHQARVNKIKATQIVIQVIRIRNDNLSFDSEYAFMDIKNRFEKTLIEYTKEIMGSLFNNGRHEYMVFTTKGAIAEIYKDDQIHSYYNNEIPFSSGIGYGSSVFTAENNARIALKYAMNLNDSSVFIVSEDGTIQGPFSEHGETISYELIEKDEKLITLSNQMNISASYLSKIKSIIENKKSKSFDVNELASLLGISSRSSRRLISKLCEADIATIIAKEKSAPVGRPRMIYKIDL